MKKQILLAILLVLISILSLPSKSGADFGSGFILGMVIGGSTSSNTHGGEAGGNTLYTMPYLLDRLPEAEFLNIKMISIDGVTEKGTMNSSLYGLTLQELFNMAMKKNDVEQTGYEILQIARIFNPQYPSRIHLHFCYIEKSRLKKLDPVIPTVKK